MLLRRRKLPVDFSRGDDFTSILIDIQERYTFTHPQMIQLRQRLIAVGGASAIAVYQTQAATRVYNRNRQQWELITEAKAKATPGVVTLDQLARAVRAQLEAGTTLDQVIALAPGALLEATKA